MNQPRAYIATLSAQQNYFMGRYGGPEERIPDRDISLTAYDVPDAVAQIDLLSIMKERYCPPSSRDLDDNEKKLWEQLRHIPAWKLLGIVPDPSAAPPEPSPDHINGYPIARLLLKVVYITARYRPYFPVRSLCVRATIRASPPN